MLNWLKKLLGLAPAETPAVPIAQAPSRPAIIGISGASGDSKSVAAMISDIRAQGAVPVFLGDHAKRLGSDVAQRIQSDIAYLDGLIVMGNDGDIDPAKYGQTKHQKTNIEADQSRAEYEERMILAAMEKNIPLLGICGGMQRINVLGGGTLHQHVPDLVGDNHHNQGKIAPFVPVQFVATLPGSRLSTMAKGQYTPSHVPLPDGVAMENSFHHQAVAEVRQDFKIAAISDDGIVEAIESKDPNRYVIGVQWHPEFGASDLSAKLTKDFTEHAREFAKHHPVSLDAAMAGLTLPDEQEARAPQTNEWRNYLAKRQTIGQGSVRYGH